MIYTGAALQFLVTQGNTFDQTLTFDDANGDPLDWTGWTARFQMRVFLDASSPTLVSLTETTGLTLGGIAGTIRIKLTPAQTTVLPAPSVLYELKATDPTGDVSTLLWGQFIVTAAVVVSP